MSTSAKCERHQVWTWQMTWADPNNEPAPKLCLLCLSESVESLRARMVDMEALTNGQLDAVRNEQAKFRVDLSELGLRTDNHNASRKSEIESESVESLRARMVDMEALTNGQLDAVRNEQAKFRVDLSELGLRTDNHNASRKSEIEYLRADVDRLDRLTEGTLLALRDVVKMGPARELRLFGAKLVSRLAEWIGDVK